MSDNVLAYLVSAELGGIAKPGNRLLKTPAKSFVAAMIGLPANHFLSLTYPGK
jgi:hypothetical protein